MSCRIVIFGSGSAGNCLLVATRSARVLVDMGFSQRRIRADLAAQRLEPERLDALLVTHTHGDHAGDPALKFCWRHRIPLVAAAENLAVLRRRFRHVMGLLDRAGLLREIRPPGLHIRGLDVRPFEVPHDAEGLTLGYHLTLAGGAASGNGGDPLRVAVATDLGHVPPEVLRVFAQAEVLVLESNHDAAMLADSGRPPYLIDRIAGPHGHLGNHQAAEAVERILSHQGPGGADGSPGMRCLVLAHLSQECNDPQLARRQMRQVLSAFGPGKPRLLTARQDERLTVLSGRP